VNSTLSNKLFILHFSSASHSQIFKKSFLKEEKIFYKMLGQVHRQESH